MRIALLSTQATADDDPDAQLGAFSLAGRSIAERQLALALALDCERIVCLSRGIDRQLLALQHQAEAAGAQFNLVSGARGLLGMMSANDELIAIADGLLPAVDEAREALANGGGVLMLPVEAGTLAGFERIDLNHAWAGVIAMPARLIERLAELPPDCDAMAGLLRIALQARVPERVLPETVLAEGRWALIRTRHQLIELEPGWFLRHAAAPDWRTPGTALARLAVRHFGGTVLERGVRPELFTAGGLLLAAGSIAAAWIGPPAAALVLFAIGWLVAECGSALAELARAGTGEESGTGGFDSVVGVLLDLGLIATLTLSLAGGWPERLFSPLVLVGLMRLGASLIPSDWRVLPGDRAVLAVILAAAAGSGVLDYTIEALALVLLALCLGLLRGTSRLTQT